jgi:hypothetical protein
LSRELLKTHLIAKFDFFLFAFAARVMLQKDPNSFFFHQSAQQLEKWKRCDTDCTTLLYGLFICNTAKHHQLTVFLRNSLNTGKIQTIFSFYLNTTMAKKTKKKKKELLAEKKELAMIEGILEGSPDGIGVVVVRLGCGCRKMAAVAQDGEPASKLIIYRDGAESVCDKCKDDNGAFMRVTESFIHWVDPDLNEEQKQMIYTKVLGSTSH